MQVLIDDISYETGLLDKHIRLACELCKVKVRKDAIVLSKQYYESCCKQLSYINKKRMKRGQLNSLDIRLDCLIWEPYPAMFQQMVDNGGKEENNK